MALGLPEASVRAAVRLGSLRGAQGEEVLRGRFQRSNGTPSLAGSMATVA